MTLFSISITCILTMMVAIIAGLTAEEWGIRSQCQAVCLKKFGSVQTNQVTHIYDLYRVHRCSSDQCKQCLNPCNWILSTRTICERQCVTEGCKGSCKLMYDLHDKIDTGRVCFWIYQISATTSEFTKQEVDRSPKQLLLDPPVVVCKETHPRLPFSGPDLGQLFIRWNVRELDGNSTFVPVVFIIAVKGQQNGIAQQHWTILGKTNYAFLPVQNLTAGETYKFQVTAVADDGVVDEPKETEWTTTLAEGAVGDPPQGIHLLEQGVDGKSMTAVVAWTPGRDPACYFKMYWMTTVDTRYNQQEVREPLPEPKLRLSGLRFDSNYTVHAYAFDREFLRSASTGKGWFVTANCLEATGGNFTICSPGPVQKLSYRIIGWHRANLSVDVSLQWVAPKFASDHNRIVTYTIGWKKVPALQSILSVNPHMNETKVAGNQTSVVIRGVHMNSVYSFWVRAQTLGGTSLPGKLVVPIDGEKAFNVGGVEQYHKSSDSTGWSNTAYIISLVIGPVVLSSVVLVIVLLIRWRRKQFSETGDQKVACLREVNPLYGFEDIPEIVIDYPCVVRDGYEVRWEDIRLLGVIGEGAFGRVMKAQLLTEAMKISDDFVAVKMPRDHLAAEEEKRDLLLEIDLMKELGHHPNVVSMLGCCTQGPNIGLIMDYCPLGDLRNYLKKHRPGVYFDLPRTSEGDQSSQGDSGLGPSKGPVLPFDDHSREGRRGSGRLRSCSDSCKDAHCYTNPSLDATVQISGTDDTEPEEGGLTDTQLLSYAWQIAGGMEFLGQQKFVHRDLAARNVLMYTDKCVKISDFGLTRDVHETSVYTPTVGKKVPVKWMPLEAIFDQTFTTKSDVWSFGVVLWEILTMGSTPYPGVDPRELLPLLKSGYRMARPENCKDEVYELMLNCWREKAAHRPTFSSLRKTLEKIMELDQSYMDLQADPDVPDTEMEAPERSGQADCSPCFRACLTPTADSVVNAYDDDWEEIPAAYCVDNPAMDLDAAVHQNLSSPDAACTPMFDCLVNSYSQQP